MPTSLSWAAGDTDQKVALGRTIAATATSPAGNISEFSGARSVVAQ